MGAKENIMKLFVILSDNGLLKAGNTTRQSLDKLEANGFTPVSYSEDFLCAMSNEENVFFLPENAQDIESLYDETNVCSISYTKKEIILQAYAKTL